MARTYVPAVDVKPAGVALPATPAGPDGHIIDGGGDVILEVRNDGPQAVTVTIQTAAEVDGYAVADQFVEVPAGERRLIGRFSPRVFDRPVGAVDPGRVYVDVSPPVEGVSIAALRV